MTEQVGALLGEYPGPIAHDSTGIGCAFYLFIRQPHGSEVSPAARNSLDSAPIPTASKLLICGLFQKGRVLAQDGIETRPTERTSILASTVSG